MISVVISADFDIDGYDLNGDLSREREALNPRDS